MPESRKTSSPPKTIPIPAPATEPPVYKPTTSNRFSTLFNPVRSFVSGTRLSADMKGLDMSYITPRILAMGYPASGLESTIRNPRSQVLNYLHQYHEGSFLVFNLCAEPRHVYDRKIFAHAAAPEGAVLVPIREHGVPSLYQIADFCQQAMNWMNQNDSNIVGVHCSSGKSRTGMMISCLLIASKVSQNAPEAISLFNEMRSNGSDSLYMPSQLRYIKLFEELLSLSNYQIPLSVTSLSVAKYSWALVGVELGPTKAMVQSIKVTRRGEEKPTEIELPLLLQQRLKNQQSMLSSFVDRKAPKVVTPDDLVIKAEFNPEHAFTSLQDASFTIKLKKSISTVPVRFWLCTEMSQTMINHRSTSDGISTFFFNSEDLDSPSNAEKSLLAAGGEDEPSGRFYVKVTIKFSKLS